MKKNFPLISVWIGQIVSLFGSGLTGFALGVWLYQRTGSASNFALVALCSALPQLIVSPLTGVLVDRYNRRLLMALADSGAALCTLAIAALFWTDHMQVGYIFLITVLSSACGALQAPAYSALVATLIPKQQLTRANGMIQLGQGLAQILAPATAGILVLWLGVAGVVMIDLVTYVVGISTLLLVPIPGLPPIYAWEVRGEANSTSHDAVGHSTPLPTDSASAPRLGFWQEVQEGWRFLRADRALMSLLSFQTLFSFLWNLFGVLVAPMVLGFTSAGGLGVTLTVAGSGMLAGSLVISVWGGPKRRLRGLLIFEFVSALAFVLMGLRPSLVLVAAAAFIAHATLAFVSSLNDRYGKPRRLLRCEGGCLHSNRRWLREGCCSPIWLPARWLTGCSTRCCCRAVRWRTHSVRSSGLALAVESRCCSCSLGWSRPGRQCVWPHRQRQG